MRNIYLSILLFAIINLSEEVNNRLPNDTRPVNYKLKFEPHLIGNNFTFDGEAEIRIQISRVTNNVTLHSKNLNIIEEETFLIGNNQTLAPNCHIYVEEGEFLILNFDSELPLGIFTMRLKFHGEMNNKPRGFFWDYYTDEGNETIYLAATQFEPSFARMAFPCWDEPALKSTFEISIIHFSNYTALSNMPIETTMPNFDDQEKIITIFQKTPPMSTYLVAFAISNFVNISNLDRNFSIWSRENAIDHMSLGLDVGLRALATLEEFTGISYQLPKMDIISIPNYIDGAMENWGLIVFKEKDILRNDSSLEDTIFKTYMYMVHEIAHQWFGNMVTPAWWSDLWITEGLATYLHYLLTAKVLNNPRIMDLFVVRNTFNVYEKEEEQLSLPLLRNVTSSIESHNLLLGVHDKSATIMHMLSGLMSQKVFQKGIRKILQKYRFGTITTDEFWKNLQETLNESNIKNNFDIKTTMEPFLSQIGYPVIDMSRNYTTGTIKLTQKCHTCPKNETESKFWIPINFAISSSLNFSSTFATHWLTPNDNELIIEGIQPDDWLIFNIQSSAFYRVNYDKQNWEMIANYLNSENFSRIHVLNRAQLLDDALWLYQQKLLERDILFNLTSYMIREVDYIPWASFDKILIYFEMQNDIINFKEYALNLVEGLVNDTGLDEKENEDIFTVLKRFIGTYWSCLLNKHHCNKVKW